MVSEEEFLKAIWGFDWDDRLLQCFIPLIFAAAFLAGAVWAAAKLRFTK